MKTGWRSLLALLLWLLAGSGTAFDRISLEASIDIDSNTISGVARTTFEPRVAPAVELNNFRFQLFPNRYCVASDTIMCGTNIDSVLINGQDVTDLTVAEETDLLINMPQFQPPESTAIVEIYFTTIIPRIRGRFGYHDGQFTLINWFPIPAPGSENGWLRIDYGENSEPAADLFDIDAVIRMPDTFQVIAPGITDINRSNGLQKVSLSLHPAQDLPLVVSTGYAVDESDVRGVRLLTYYRPENAYVVDTLKETTRRTLEYMAANVSAYPFDELVVVAGGLTIGGGLELPRMVLLSSPMTDFARSYQLLLIHEIVHQWFYGILVSNQADEPWLDEAITEYFAEKINRTLVTGRADMLSRFGITLNQRAISRALSRNVWTLVPIDRPADTYNRSDYARAVYHKGALVIATLTGIMGEESERQFWLEYAARFAFARPARADFIQLAAEYVPTDDPARVADLISTIAPLDFSIKSVSSTPIERPSDSVNDSTSPLLTHKITVECLTIHPLGLPVDLLLEFADGSVKDTNINPTSGRHLLEFEATSRAVCATIDPRYKYAIDENLMNNSLQVVGNSGNGARFLSGLLYMVESLFSTVWGI